jgi:1-deoxy-D-xylulose-5-phosphate synthase
MSEPENGQKLPEDFYNTPLLDGINSPEDLKKLSLDDLKTVAEEVRRKILSVVARNGGHLASPLGVVEITLAVHYVFDTPKDQVIWDVGHQCYAHKLITGRRDAFPTLRKQGGISGYPRPSESEYDAFGVGHSSTSISAGLGMAVARDQRGTDERIVSIIGDGAMTGGMAFEALSHAGHLGTDLLVILNDNEMSISKNVGALSSYFSRLITAGVYTRAKGDLQGFMKRMLGDNISRAAQHLEHSVKSLITAGGLFEDLGFKYVGPVAGNDLDTLIDCLRNIKKLHGPVLFHCVTNKGCGYTHAEADPLKYHGVVPLNIPTGEFEGEARPSAKERQKPPSKTFTSAFSAAIIEEAQKDDKVVAITAAMPTGTGLSQFQEAFPDRFFDVGICEQHAVTFAAGLAARGFKPVAAIYSTFLQRGYDQYIHDVCLQNLPVVFAIDRAGLVGEDSPTQQGAYDLSFLRVIPNATVLAPRDDLDLQAMLRWALAQSGPVAIRYARCKAPTIGSEGDRDVTCAEVLREGEHGYILSLGPCAEACLKAAEELALEGLSVGVVDMRFVKPLDTAMLDRLAHLPLITVEENTLEGGFGSAVMEYFEMKGRLREVNLKRLGFADVFIPQATRNEQLQAMGLDALSIAAAARLHIEQTAHHHAAS